jgi:cyclase
VLCKRIIPCLDIKNGRTVKGVQFVDLIDAGDPIALARDYSMQGADELVFLDITASIEGRSTLYELVQKVAEVINIPFTVGGGIDSLEVASRVITSGADKVSLNSAAVRNPDLIDELAGRFGSQSVIIAIDTKFIDNEHTVIISGGRTITRKKTLEWAKEVAERGAGEILLTSMDHDGTKSGFANELTSLVSKMVSIPVIASGGAGEKKDFLDVFTSGNADAALAASLFHFGEITIQDLKEYLHKSGITVRRVK